MLRLREAGSSQDLHVSIIHEVVLRYANMNYLTSRPASPSTPLPPSLSLYTLLSILAPFLKIWVSSQNSIFFLEPSSPNNLGLSGNLSLPLCLSLCRVFLPLYRFSSFLTISMRFVCVPSASAFVFEAEGETQAPVRWTFDEEESRRHTRWGRERAYEVYELLSLASFFSLYPWPSCLSG